MPDCSGSQNNLKLFVTIGVSNFKEREEKVIKTEYEKMLPFHLTIDTRGKRIASNSHIGELLFCSKCYAQRLSKETIK